MSEKINEQLSAFLDGELSEQELDLFSRRLLTDPELRAQLARYQLASESIQGGYFQCDFEQILEGVSATIDTVNLDETEPLPVSQSRYKRFFRPVLGGAIAASVAAVTVSFVLNSNAPIQVNAPASPIMSAQSVSPPSSVQTVSTPAGGQIIATSAGTSGSSVPVPPEGGEQMKWERMSPEMRARISGYMVNHGGYSRTNSMTGVPTDYVRIVGQQNSENMEEK